MDHTPTSIGNRRRALVPALLVLAVGVLFLLYNLGIDFAWLAHWWAWFVLLASIVPLSRALHGYRTRGRCDTMVLRDLLNAAVIIAVAVIFLLELQWSTWWPVFVIYAGLHMLIGRRE